MSRICDVSRGRDHVVRFTRPSAFWLSFCILQAIKNRSRGRPGNEATWAMGQRNKHRGCLGGVTSPPAQLVTQAHADDEFAQSGLNWLLYKDLHLKSSVR